jgi:type VI secretion system protein ImpF
MNAGGPRLPKGAAGMRIRMPILDRLLDDDPGTAIDPPVSPTAALEALHAAVRRDLEALLSARRRRWPLPPALAELVVSPLGYGIPDAASGSYAIAETRAELALEVERVIKRFEPRLQSVQVEIVDTDADLERTLRLRVAGVLRTDPVVEPVSFETVIEAVSHEVHVAERN